MHYHANANGDLWTILLKRIQKKVFNRMNEIQIKIGEEQFFLTLLIYTFFVCFTTSFAVLYTLRACMRLVKQPTY